MKNIKTDKQVDQDFFDSNFDKLVSVKDEYLRKVVGAAKNTARTLNKSSIVNMRANANDLAGIKDRAAKAGIPYQTYLGIIIKQVASGKLEIKI